MFGAWDEKDPKSAEGFTVIFQKVKEEKHIAATNFPPIPQQSATYNLNTSKKDTRRSKAVPTHGVAEGVGALQGVVMEIIITFALVYTVYATACDPKKGALGTIAPIAIGFIVGANILAAGPFSGGSMNPARSFGPAVASFNFSGHWIYWVGPLVGGGLAGAIYPNVFISNEHIPLSNDY